MAKAFDKGEIEEEVKWNRMENKKEKFFFFLIILVSEKKSQRLMAKGNKLGF